MPVSALTLTFLVWWVPRRWHTDAVVATDKVPPVGPAGEDAAWLVRVAQGDETALQRIFDKWKLPLLSFFYRALGSHADAEYLTLEVFVRPPSICRVPVNPAPSPTVPQP